MRSILNARLASDHVRYLKSDLETLFRIQSRIAAGEIVAGKLFVHYVVSTTGTFGNVVAGHFQMNSSRDSAFGPMGFKKTGYLRKNVIKIFD